jgi:hypothetical protein
MLSSLYGQFPAPRSFQFTYEYFMIDEWGFCRDSTIFGPAYCSHFSWSPPDTTQTSAKLEYYRIYHDDFPLVSLADTFYHTIGGFIGKLYVTAVYSLPEGESDSSNVVYNYELPISYGNDVTVEKTRLYYRKTDNRLIPLNGENLLSLGIYDILGREVLFKSPVGGTVDMAGFRPGLYFVRSVSEQNRVSVQKILVE